MKKYRIRENTIADGSKEYFPEGQHQEGAYWQELWGTLHPQPTMENAKAAIATYKITSIVETKYIDYVD